MEMVLKYLLMLLTKTVEGDLAACCTSCSGGYPMEPGAAAAAHSIWGLSGSPSLSQSPAQQCCCVLAWVSFALCLEIAEAPITLFAQTVVTGEYCVA